MAIKKPRRVRARRREKIVICFRPRHVRGRKHFSARKRANCLLSADNECAAAGRNLPLGKGFAFFEGLLLHELLHLVQQGAEQIQGILDGLGAGHVHPGAFEQVHRIL